MTLRIDLIRLYLIIWQWLAFWPALYVIESFHPSHIYTDAHTGCQIDSLSAGTLLRVNTSLIILSDRHL